MCVYKNISQIFLSNSDQEIPSFIKSTSSSLDKIFKDHTKIIYDNRMLIDFIKLYFDKDVLLAFKKLKPLAFKADLARYCLLYKLGGWYFDIAIRCIRRYDIPEETDLLCFRDEQRHSKTSWAVCNGIIWSRSKNIIHYKSIEKIIRNCRTNWYGRTPLCPSGPALFGEAIAENNREQKIIYGDLIRPNIPFTRKNLPILYRIFKAKFYLPNGKPFALLKPAKGGDLKKLGVRSSDNYNDYWKNKDIYNQEIKDL